jgi:hypothetical protein
MIEPDSQRIMLKDQRRAKHMFCETLTPQNSLMLECFEELSFTLHRPLDRPSLLVRRSSVDREIRTRRLTVASLVCLASQS